MPASSSQNNQLHKLSASNKTKHSQNRHRDFAPLFVVGCPRSGTTLLTVLLDRHDEIVMTPETHFFLTLRQFRRAGVPSTHEAITDYFLRSPHMATLELDREDVLHRLRDDEPTCQSFFRRALESFASRSPGASRVGEKTPMHILDIPTILNWFPQSRIIWILRDGRDSVQSMMRTDLFRVNRRQASFVWRCTIQAGTDYLARYPENMTRIRFEDLLREPRRELERICDFLGIPFQEKQLDPCTGTGVVLNEETHKQRSLGSLDPSKIGEFASQTDDREKWLMDSVMARHLERLGYPPTRVRRPPLRVRLEDAALNAPLAILHDYRIAPHQEPILAFGRKWIRPLLKRQTQRA